MNPQAAHLRKLRGLAYFRVRRLGAKAVAAEVGMGQRALSDFAHYGKTPGSRNLAKLERWFAEAGGLPPAPFIRGGMTDDAVMVVLSLDVLLEDFNWDEQWVGRGIILWLLAELYARNGVTPPPEPVSWPLRLVKERGESFLEELRDMAYGLGGRDATG